MWFLKLVVLPPAYFICVGHDLHQRFSVPVFAAPRSAYFACLSLLTHLIQIISSLEVRSMDELCFDWYAPYTGSIAPCSLLPQQGKSVVVYFTSEHSFGFWSSWSIFNYTRTRVSIYNIMMHIQFLAKMFTFTSDISLNASIMSSFVSHFG